MLTTLLLAGVFGDGEVDPGPVLTVPVERVIRLTKTSAFVTAAFSIDPTDVLNFELNLTGLLEQGEAFASITIALLPASVVQGFDVPGSGPFGVAEIAPGRLQFWPIIDLAEQARAAWAGQGTSCGFEVLGETDTTPPRRWQRTVQIRVVQK